MGSPFHGKLPSIATLNDNIFQWFQYRWLTPHFHTHTHSGKVCVSSQWPTSHEILCSHALLSYECGRRASQSLPFSVIAKTYIDMMCCSMYKLMTLHSILGKCKIYLWIFRCVIAHNIVRWQCLPGQPANVWQRKPHISPHRLIHGVGSSLHDCASGGGSYALPCESINVEHI